MAKPMDGGTWEICKLASDKNKEHRGCGSAVFEAALNWAKDHGAKRLFILSNSRLKSAIHIYEKFGFKKIKLDDYEYVRGDIAFEKWLQPARSFLPVFLKKQLRLGPALIHGFKLAFMVFVSRVIVVFCAHGAFLYTGAAFYAYACKLTYVFRGY